MLPKQGLLRIGPTRMGRGAKIHSLLIPFAGFVISSNSLIPKKTQQPS